MASTSMNGWQLIANDSGPLARISAGGLSTTVRAGDVAAVLEYVGRAFHAEVEQLRTFYGWRSIALNTQVGGHPRSNHPSGTAIDCNGARHPRYARGTFTAAQVAAIRRILAAAAPVVRWGGDWGADVDEMHFEVVGTAAQVAAVAARVRPWLTVAAPAAPALRPPAPAPAPAPIPTTVWEDDMRGLFEALYRTELGREGSTADVDRWTVAASADGLTAKQATERFRSSKAERGTVVAVYRELLGRAPAEREITTWLSSKPTIAAVRTGVAGSQEAKGR